MVTPAVGLSPQEGLFCLEQGTFHLLQLSQFEGHVRTADKGLGTINPLLIDHLCSACKNSVAIATDEVCGRSWRGEAAELFRADRNPESVFQEVQTLTTGFTLSVIAGAETKQTGTDQATRGRRSTTSHGLPPK